MKSKLIRSDKDLLMFSSKCGKKLNLEYPMEYLKVSKVRAFYNKYDAMIGGYIINEVGPFRVIESLPTEVKSNSPWVKEEVLSNSYELTGLWLDRKIVGRFANFFFWLTMYKDLIFTKKKYFVYAYDLDKTYLKKLYAIANPSVIYSGKTAIQEGMMCECEESVEIASVNYIRLAFFYNFDYFFKKLFISRRKASRYSVSMAMKLKGKA
jgi:hypothetical protein